jgi:hypothetical protein
VKAKRRHKVPSDPLFRVKYIHVVGEQRTEALSLLLHVHLNIQFSFLSGISNYSWS